MNFFSGYQNGQTFKIFTCKSCKNCQWTNIQNFSLERAVRTVRAMSSFIHSNVKYTMFRMFVKTKPLLIYASTITEKTLKQKIQF